MTSSHNGQVVTFYSFKGGTGRTMALANVAWILAANGKRVLVVDWDLESPGPAPVLQPVPGRRTALRQHRRRHRPDPRLRVGTTARAAAAAAGRAGTSDFARVRSATRSRSTGRTSRAAARSTSCPPAGRTATTPPTARRLTGTTSTTGWAAASSSTRCGPT